MFSKNKPAPTVDKANQPKPESLTNLYILLAVIVVIIPLAYYLLNNPSLFKKPEPTPTPVSLEIPDLTTPEIPPDQGYVRLNIPYVIKEVTTANIIVRGMYGDMVITNDPVKTRVVDENGNQLTLADVKVGQGAIVDAVPGESVVIHLYQ